MFILWDHSLIKGGALNFLQISLHACVQCRQRNHWAYFGTSQKSVRTLCTGLEKEPSSLQNYLEPQNNCSFDGRHIVSKQMLIVSKTSVHIPSVFKFWRHGILVSCTSIEKIELSLLECLGCKTYHTHEQLMALFTGERGREGEADEINRQSL